MHRRVRKAQKRQQGLGKPWFNVREHKNIQERIVHVSKSHPDLLGWRQAAAQFSLIFYKQQVNSKSQNAEGIENIRACLCLENRAYSALQEFIPFLFWNKSSKSISKLFPKKAIIKFSPHLLHRSV